MLRCLTEKRDELSSEQCRKEVYYFQKMEVSNYHNDVILAAQCRADVEKFCKNIQPGEQPWCIASSMSRSCSTSCSAAVPSTADSATLRLHRTAGAILQRGLCCHSFVMLAGGSEAATNDSADASLPALICRIVACLQARVVCMLACESTERSYQTVAGGKK